MNWTNEAKISFRTMLANTYPMVDDSRLVVEDLEFDATRIAFDNKAITNWFNILKYAENQNKLDALFEFVLEEYPENDALLQLKKGNVTQLSEGPETKQWNGPERKSSLEKIIGARSTLVPVAYYETGVDRARSVVRINREDGTVGSGFVVEGNFLVTNNHVLPTVDIAAKAIAQFNYQTSVDGLSSPIHDVRILPDGFKTSIEHDWTIVKLDGKPTEKWGALSLSGFVPKVGDYVNIIQHPGGGPKQISLAANTVAYVDENRIQYLTDTLPGSSGSPVFDTQWNVVALHHSGGWISEPKASSKTTYYRNEGISIKLIKEALES